MDQDIRSTADVRPEGDAITNARHRLALLAETVGTRHPEYATGLNQLALLLIMQGDPTSAEPYLREALEVRRQSLGESHPDYATNLSSLGGLLWARGALGEAEPLLRQAAEVRVATLGDTHPKTVVSLNSLEQLIEARRSLASAEQEQQTTGDAPEAPTPTTATVSLHRFLPPAAVSARVAPGTPVFRTVPTDASVDRVGETPSVVQDGVTLATSQADLEALADELSGLGNRFVEAARALLDQGQLPPTALIDDARSTRRRFDAFREMLRTLARTVEVPAFEPGGDVATLAADITALHEAVSNRTHWVQERQEAVACLRLVESLACPGDPSFAPLAACHAEAVELRQSIGAHDLVSQHGAVGDLLRGEHRLTAVLEFVSADQELDDEHWARLFDRVEAEFGSSLAVAIARGRIRPSAF